jgi:hypothetical protein
VFEDKESEPYRPGGGIHATYLRGKLPSTLCQHEMRGLLLTLDVGA